MKNTRNETYNKILLLYLSSVLKRQDEKLSNNRKIILFQNKYVPKQEMRGKK